MVLKLKAAPPPDSDDDSVVDDDDELSNKRIKLIKEISEPIRENKFASGIVIALDSESDVASTSASMSAAEKKGLKEVKELERELDLKNTFSRETNRRDEDAEMNKYIEEQIRLKREQAKRERDANRTDTKRSLIEGESKSNEADLFALPATVTSTVTENVDDILLHILSQNYSSKLDEKSEAMLSSQMLNGIPEVDLGMSEKIRTIEATEEAKLRLTSTSESTSNSHRSNITSKKTSIPTNFSCNYQSHRGSRDKRDGVLNSQIGPSRGSSHNNHHNHSKVETRLEPVVSVGEEPHEIELKLPTSTGYDHRPPPKGRASDDYYLQKYKKNNRR